METKGISPGNNRVAMVTDPQVAKIKGAFRKENSLFPTLFPLFYFQHVLLFCEVMNY